MNLAQVRAFEDALEDFANIVKNIEDERISVSVIAEKRLPVILQCVVEWHIEGVPEKPTEDTYPMTPIGAAGDLATWLFGEIQKIWMGEVADPKD